MQVSILFPCPVCSGFVKVFVVFESFGEYCSVFVQVCVYQSCGGSELRALTAGEEALAVHVTCDSDIS